MTQRLHRLITPLAALLALACAAPVLAAPQPAIQQAAQTQQQGMLDALRELVNIESGSKDVEGLTRLATGKLTLPP